MKWGFLFLIKGIHSQPASKLQLQGSGSKRQAADYGFEHKFVKYKRHGDGFGHGLSGTDEQK